MSRSRVVVLFALFAACALVVPPPAAAQTRPDADLYRGPMCFATIMPSVDAGVGHVSGSRDPGKRILSQGDVFFVTADTGAELEEGAAYDLFRIEGTVEHPHTGRRVGEAAMIVGRLRVVDVAGDRALARLVESCGEIEIGDRLHPGFGGDLGDVDAVEIDADRLITPREADATVVYGSSESLPTDEGQGRQHMTVRRSYAGGDVVTIDRGRVHGWDRGTGVLFYETEFDTSEDARAGHEPVVVGTGVVIWAEADTAAVLILEAERTVSIGSRGLRAGASDAAGGSRD